MQSDERLRDEATEQVAGSNGQLVTRRVGELRAHPSYVRHGLAVSAAQLSALEERGDLAFQDPVLITTDGTVIDGYARWNLARWKGRPTLLCRECEPNQTESVQMLIRTHRRLNGFNAFVRILLALELEPFFKERARSNQRAGGQKKGSSSLTEAERLDVRSEVAAAAGVSVGNVTKVKQLKVTAHPEVLLALSSREISIHRAWLWSKEPSHKHLAELRRHRDNRATHKIKRLVSRHKPKSVADVVDPSVVVRRLAGLDSNELAAVSVRVVKGPGKAIYLTKDLLQSLQPYQEQMPT